MSEGRGTTKPFEYIGAPWGDGERWAQALNILELPGVLFRPVAFTPAPVNERTKHANQVCSGISIHVTDRERFQPVVTALHCISILVSEFGDHFAFLQKPQESQESQSHFDRLAGNDSLQDALLKGIPVADIQAEWHEEYHAWRENAAQYHIY